MHDLLGTARLMLVTVLAVAGTAKLTAPRTTRRAVREFGVPYPLVTPVAAALPVTELAVAGGLCWRRTAWWAAAAAAGLLIAFALAAAAQLATGRRPSCGCLGELQDGTVGLRTVVLDMLLAGAAVLVVAVGPGAVGPNLAPWLFELHGVRLTVVAVSVALSLGAFLAVPHRPMPPASETPTALAAPPGFMTVVIESGPRCEDCAEMLADVARWYQTVQPTFGITVVGAASDDSELPIAMLVGPDGEARGTPVRGAHAVRRMIADLDGGTLAPLPAARCIPCTTSEKRSP
ncbi:MauE/DoxX family redox-associated membrane protein [Streptomyces prunicolor]|uniref:MauE/DoxX family redox-associated membrane protein n=1 Tax=Streptomyces prunicolor TaxID=67348 RepID=A0ABU4FW33_9ACTN|nr:MauE/DoxX family redox-associated membrane protein [Streptomyces prunicolor]MDV7223490.1 MauE/DoxX family redox-associated membrane protein [Streptomyces prunicolor]